MALTIAALLLIVGQDPVATATTTLIPPRAISSTTIAYPGAAIVPGLEIEVVVRMRVDERGDVKSVELDRGVGEPFDSTVLAAVARFRFAPATYGGQPVPVDLRYTARFTPPPLALAPVVRPGVITGRLRERGTRFPVPYASVSAGNLETLSDEQGNFRLEVTPGAFAVEITLSGFLRFVQQETVGEGEELAVAYLVERAGNNPYEVLVVGERVRAEVSRTTIRGKELTQVAGTFGDPFRVVNTLPGVSTMMSLLPFPVVRGSSPGNTGFLIDGVRVPLLFHLLAGPSVVHPALIESIDFMPGGFPVDYGGYTGGIVDGKTRPARSDEIAYDVDLNFFQTGGLVRHPLPLPGLTGTLSGRVGYPGLLISLASPNISLSYWDYQARIDGGDRRFGYSLFAFGANDGLDTLPDGAQEGSPLEPFLQLTFHRVDLRSWHDDGAVHGDYQLTFGYDDSLSQDDAKLSSLSVPARGRLAFTLTPALVLTVGFDGLIKQGSFTASTMGAGTIGELLGTGGEPESSLYTTGLIAELVLTPTERWSIRPGVRVDVYMDGKSAHAGVDPRVLARYALDDDLWLKASVGLYHQPPRFAIPVPGLDQVAFDKGLLEATQASIGAELALDGGFSIDVQTYFNWMDPILFDVQFNPSVEDILNDPPVALPGQAPNMLPSNTDDVEDRLDRLLQPATGRSYGFEMLLRRQSADGISGWLSYTLSRSERLRDGGWSAFDFDRTHILNLVLQMPLPRRWQLGFRAQMQTGRPLTTTAGLSSTRASTFVRFDVRIDKTAVWNDWLLDFYVDVSNTVLAAEELQPGTDVRYVLPTLGFRAMF
mgnify:CR=1 FL=1